MLTRNGIDWTHTLFAYRPLRAIRGHRSRFQDRHFSARRRRITCLTTSVFAADHWRLLPRLYIFSVLRGRP